MEEDFGLLPFLSPMRSFIQLFALLAFSAALLSEAPAQPTPAAELASSDYVVKSSDLLRVQIFQENDLARDVRVSQDGTITLPLIGSITVAGKSIRQIEEQVTTLYDRDYLVNPQVNVIVLEYGARTVNILGSVNNPGAISFPQERGLTLLDGIARAGGFTRLADRKKVKLTRTTAEGRTENFVINADDLIQGTSRDQWILLKDDIIYVPERIL